MQIAVVIFLIMWFVFALKVFNDEKLMWGKLTAIVPAVLFGFWFAVGAALMIVIFLLTTALGIML